MCLALVGDGAVSVTQDREAGGGIFSKRRGIDIESFLGLCTRFSLSEDARGVGIGDYAELAAQPDHEIAALVLIEVEAVEFHNELSGITRYAREYARHLSLN